jgi:hypothetical protein
VTCKKAFSSKNGLDYHLRKSAAHRGSNFAYSILESGEVTLTALKVAGSKCFNPCRGCGGVFPKTLAASPQQYSVTVKLCQTQGWNTVLHAQYLEQLSGRMRKQKSSKGSHEASAQRTLSAPGAANSVLGGNAGLKNANGDAGVTAGNSSSVLSSADGIADDGDTGLAKWVRVLSGIGGMPANHGNPIKTLIERAINAALAEGFAQVAASLRHAISRAIFKSNSAGQCKRAVLETMSAYGGVAATHAMFNMADTGAGAGQAGSMAVESADHTRHGTVVGLPSRSPLNPVASSLADRDRAPQTAPAAAHAPVAPRPTARGRVEAVSRLPPASYAQPFRSSGRQRRKSTKRLEAEQLDARLAAEHASRVGAASPHKAREGFVEGVLPLTEFALGKARTVASGTAASPCDVSVRLGRAPEKALARPAAIHPFQARDSVEPPPQSPPVWVAGPRDAPAFRFRHDATVMVAVHQGHLRVMRPELAPVDVDASGGLGRPDLLAAAVDLRREALDRARCPVRALHPSFFGREDEAGQKRRQAKRFECNPRTVHPVLFRRCVRKLRHRQTSGPTAITRGWQPPHPEAVRLLYRYTFASTECVGTGLNTFRFTEVPGLARVARVSTSAILPHGAAAAARVAEAEAAAKAAEVRKVADLKGPDCADDENDEDDAEERALLAALGGVAQTRALGDEPRHLGCLMRSAVVQGRYNVQAALARLRDPFVRAGCMPLSRQEWEMAECPDSERVTGLFCDDSDVEASMREVQSERAAEHEAERLAVRRAVARIDALQKTSRSVPPFFRNDWTRSREKGDYCFRPRGKKKKRRRRHASSARGRADAEARKRRAALEKERDAEWEASRLDGGAQMECPFPGCKRRCATIAAMRRHIQAHKRRKQILREEQDFAPADDEADCEPGPCFRCGKDGIRGGAGMRVHLALFCPAREINLEDECPPYRCCVDRCDKVFSTRNGLVYHLQRAQAHAGTRKRRGRRTAGSGRGRNKKAKRSGAGPRSDRDNAAKREREERLRRKRVVAAERRAARAASRGGRGRSRAASFAAESSDEPEPERPKLYSATAYGEEVVDRRVRVYEPNEIASRVGVIRRHNARSGKHQVIYDGKRGQTVWIVLQHRKIELLSDEPEEGEEPPQGEEETLRAHEEPTKAGDRIKYREMATSSESAQQRNDSAEPFVGVVPRTARKRVRSPATTSERSVKRSRSTVEAKEEPEAVGDDDEEAVSDLGSDENSDDCSADGIDDGSDNTSDEGGGDLDEAEEEELLGGPESSESEEGDGGDGGDISEDDE